MSLRPVLVVALVGLGLGSCLGPPDSVGSRVTKAVAVAKRRGQTDVAVPRRLPDGTRLTLDRVAANFSIAVVEAVQLDVALTAHDLVTTWHKFKVVTELLSRESRSSWCDGFEPARVPLGRGEFLVPLLTGTMEVRGVRVQSKTSDGLVKPRLGQQYLALFAACPGRVSRVVFGPFGWFEIGPDGELRAAPNRLVGERPFVDEILSGKSVRSLASRLGR